MVETFWGIGDQLRKEKRKTLEELFQEGFETSATKEEVTSF